MFNTLFTEDSVCMSDKSTLGVALKNESVIKCPKREEEMQLTQNAEMETKHDEETSLKLILAAILNYVSKIISDLLVMTQTFFEDCTYFFKRCTFPDLEGMMTAMFKILVLNLEFCSVMKRIGWMFLILGTLSYVIALASIVIKDILRT